MADRWITFDCYGTLIDWHSGIRAGLQAAGAGVTADLAERMAADYERLEQDLERGAYRPYRDIQQEVLSRLFSRYGLHPPENPHALTEGLPSWPPYPEVPEVLRHLARTGFQLGILSNIDRDLIQASLRRLPVSFEVVVTAEDVTSYKPAPAHWTRFLDQTGTTAGEVIHVAQGLRYDMAAAIPLGFRTVWVNRLGEDPGGVRPDHVIADLSGLSALLTP
jgi:2-haloacid dehalogenase